MNNAKIAALALVVAGALALTYGGFTYTKNTHRADLGPMHLTVAENRYVSVPLWVGLGAVLGGGVLLFVRTKQ